MWKILYVLLLFLSVSNLIVAQKNKSLDDMFLQTKIVKEILEKMPKYVLPVIVNVKGKNTTAHLAGPLEAPAARTNNYIVDIPQEYFDTWRFQLHSYLYEDMDHLRQIIGYLQMNRNRYRIYYRDIEYRTNLKEYIAQYFRKDEVIPANFSHKFPIDCKFLGSKNITFYDVWLYGSQQESLNYRPLRKYVRLRTEFNIKDFIDKYSLKVTHGATLQYNCTMRTVQQMKHILLPFVLLWSFIGLYGAIFMVYAEVEKARQAERAAARAAKEREQREYNERLAEYEAREQSDMEQYSY